MRIIALSTLRDFWEIHRDAEKDLRDWYSDVSKAEWGSPLDAKKYASNVSILSNDRLCFNIKGNQYRLVVLVNYAKSKIYIKFIGTHQEYDKTNVETVQLKKEV